MKESEKHACFRLALLLLISTLSFLYPQSGSGTVLDVPEVFQEHDQWCWAGVSQPILQYYGTVLTQTNIAAYGTSGYNTWNYLYGSDTVAPYYRKGINLILNHFGAISTASNNTYLSQSTVQTEIDAGRPFVIRWGWYSGGGHFLVGRGIETNTIHYMDPWPGEGYLSATYSWVVDDGTHKWTHSLELTTSVTSSPPQTPTGVSASDGTYEDKVRVTWNAVGSATGYQVWRNVSNSTSSASNIESGITSTQYDDTSVSAGQIYYYWVKATNSVGVSGFSNADTGYCAQDGSAPSAPTGVSASDGTYEDKVRVTWNAVGSATGYSIWRHTANDSDSASQIAGNVTTTTYDDSSAWPGWTYYYWVKATNSAGASGFSDGDSGWRRSAVAAGKAYGDMDGDGKSDLVVYHGPTGYWYMLLSGSSYALSYMKLGESGYTPVSGDFDGDGKSDLAVYHESTGYWYMLMSGSSYALSYMKLGESGYIAVYTIP